MNFKLQKFLTKERVSHLSNDEVEQVRQASLTGDVYAKYCYARWLYYSNPYKGAVNDAEELFFATMNVVPDSMAAYAQMLRYGETETTHTPNMDIEGSKELLQKALEQGSMLAAVQDAKNRMFGIFFEEEPTKIEPEKVAEEIEKRLVTNVEKDSYWYLLLAFAYERMERDDDAIRLYEQAVTQGETDAYAYLANLYQKRGNQALYEEYMEEGCEKGCSLCMMYQSDMSEDDFKSLSESMQTQIYKNIDERLNRGLQMGEGICCYYLWHHYYYGTHGFTKDVTKSFTYLQRGVELYDMFCAEQMGIEALQGNLPETISLSLAEIGELWLQVARFDPLNVDAVIQLCELDDPTFKLKHKEEIEKYWEPIYKSYWAENKELDSQHDDWRLFDDDWRTDDDDYEDDDGRYDAYV